MKDLVQNKKNYRIVSLGDICEKIIGGGTPSRSEPSYWKGDINWLTVKDLDKRTEIYSAQEKITRLGLENSASNIIPKNNIITSTRMGIGRFYINKIDTSINQDLKGLIINQQIANLYFVLYSLLSHKDELEMQGTGTTVKGIKIEDLRSLKLLLPPLEDQEKIAEILLRVDEEIEKVDQTIEKTKQLKKGLMQDLLTKGIGHSKFKKTELGEIPEEWEVVSLKNISENLDNLRVPVTKSKRIEGLYPYYGATGIVDYVDEYIFDDELLLISEDGANLKDRNYPIAFVAKGKYWVNNHAHIQKFNDKYLQKFVHDYLNFINLEEYLTGMAQPKLNKDRLYSIPIPKPTDDVEIKKIAEILWMNDDAILINNQMKAKLELLKKGLMQDLLQ